MVSSSPCFAGSFTFPSSSSILFHSSPFSSPTPLLVPLIGLFSLSRIALSPVIASASFEPSTKFFSNSSRSSSNDCSGSSSIPATSPPTSALSKSESVSSAPSSPPSSGSISVEPSSSSPAPKSLALMSSTGTVSSAPPSRTGSVSKIPSFILTALAPFGSLSATPSPSRSS